MSLLRAKPMRQRSEKQARFEADLAKAKRVILQRSKSACELCGCRDERLDAHHPFSRHELGAWTNHPDCLVVVCRPCHRLVTDASTTVAHDLAEQSRQQVVGRLMARFGGVVTLADESLARHTIRLTELLGDPA